MNEPAAILFVTGPHCIALRPADGSRLWTFECPHGEIVRFCRAAGRIYLLSSDMVVCLDASDGVVVGTAELEPGFGGGEALLGDDDRVLAATSRGVWALDHAGRILWSAPAPASNLSGRAPFVGLAAGGQVQQPDYLD